MAFAAGFVYGVLGLVVFHVLHEQNVIRRSLTAASSTYIYKGAAGKLTPHGLVLR
jgi:hypothetical protein